MAEEMLDVAGGGFELEFAGRLADIGRSSGENLTEDCAEAEDVGAGFEQIDFAAGPGTPA